MDSLRAIAALSVLVTHAGFLSGANLGAWYGDYTARGDLGHMLAVIEALLGQLYLVTVVALLVSRIRPSRGDA